MIIKPRFDHVGLNVTALDASITFLKEMFGFEVIQKWNSNTTGIYRQRGSGVGLDGEKG